MGTAAFEHASLEIGRKDLCRADSVAFDLLNNKTIP